MEIVNLKDLINKPGIVRKVVKIEKINNKPANKNKLFN